MALSLEQFVGHLSEKERQKVLEQLTHKSFKKGAIIIQQGDNDTFAYYILSGSVSVSVKKDREEDTFITNIDEGSFVGEYSSLVGGTRSATVIARKDTDVIVFEREEFLDFVTMTQEAAQVTVKYLADILRAENKIKVNIMTRDARGRVLSYFWNSYEKNYSRSFTIPKIKELASQLNLASETLSRQISSLIKEGIIERDNKKITLLELDKIREEL